jgi:hypothetical protein
MKRTVKIFFLLIAMFIALNTAAFAVNVEITSNYNDTHLNEGVVNESGTPIPWMSGYVVQIIKLAGSSPNPPASNGDPTGGDTVIGTVEVGDWSFGIDGYIYSNVTASAGDRLICRLFNNPDRSIATYYGNSEIYTVSTNAFQSWDVNGSTDIPAFATSMVFDSTPPSPPTNMKVTQEAHGDLFATWTASVSPDTAGTRIIWRTDGYATDQLDYTGSNYADIAVAAAQVLRNTGLTHGTRYYYAAFAYDTSNNYSGAATSSEVSNDIVPPSVTTTEPISSAVGVDTSSNITVTFDDNMSPSDTINAFEMTAQNGTSVAGSGSLSPANQLIFDPGTDLVGNTTYRCTLGATARDDAGNLITSSFTWTFRTAGSVITAIPPRIENIKFDGWNVKAGDVIAPRPRITADITDPNIGISEITTIEITVDTISYIYSFTQLPAIYSANFMDFRLPANLASGAHTFTIRAENTVGDISQESIPGLLVAGGEVRIIGQFVNFPAEVDSGKGTTFAYTLSAASDIQIYIYGISGIVFKKKIPNGAPGTKAGYNEVFWDGLNSLGNPLGNGMYIVLIASGDKKLGKMNLIIKNKP